MNPIRSQLQFPDCVLVTTTAPFDRRDSLADFPVGLKITEQQNIVREIADVDRTLQGPSNCPGLRQNHYREHATIAEISQKFVEMDSQELLSRHGLQISIQAIKHNHADVLVFNVLLTPRDH